MTANAHQSVKFYETHSSSDYVQQEQASKFSSVKLFRKNQ